MIYLIVDKKCESNILKIDEYKNYLKNLYNDDVECIIQDNRVITPLGDEGRLLEERGEKICEILKFSKSVYLYREEEFIMLK